MMTFSGVRSSCETVARNSDLSRFARSSSATFSSSAARLPVRLSTIALNDRARRPISSCVGTSTLAWRSPRAIASAAEARAVSGRVMARVSTTAARTATTVKSAVKRAAVVTVRRCRIWSDSRELRARVATGLDQVLAEVLQAALRQDPALDDAHEDDERGGGEPEAGPKA